MNIEEVINNLKKYISFSEKECNFSSIYDWNWHMDLANDIETLLTAYEKQNKIIDLMAKTIDNYDSQLEINYFKDVEHIKQYFAEYAEEEV